MKTTQYWVTIPSEIEDTAGEVIKRIAGTDMTWEPYYGERDFYVNVPVDSDDEDIVEEQSARRIFAAFGDINDPVIEELPYPPSASSFIRFYDKQRRRAGGGKNGLCRTVEGGCEVMFAVLPHSQAVDSRQAAAECERQIAAIIAGQEMKAMLDKPVWRSTLKGTGEEVYFAAYLLGVKAKWHEDWVERMKEIDEAAMLLSARLKDRKVYAELDDFGGTSLKMMVEYLIPKRRGELPRKRGGESA